MIYPSYLSPLLTRVIERSGQGTLDILTLPCTFLLKQGFLYYPNEIHAIRDQVSQPKDGNTDGLAMVSCYAMLLLAIDRNLGGTGPADRRVDISQ